MNRVRTNSFLFQSLLSWVFLSAFYYAPNLITGQLLVDRSENFVHKIAKYFIAIALTALYTACYRDVTVLVQGLFLCMFTLLLGVQLMAGINVIFGLELMLVFTAFYGLAHYSSRLTASQISSLANAIVYSAFFISVISYFEFTIFESVLGDRWKSTGGFRSVSTLLNPNNFGVYLGAALILIVFSDNLTNIKRALFGVVILGALYLSGSRTAWVSFAFASLLGIVYRGRGLFDRKSLLKLSIVVCLAIPIVAIVLVGGFVELPERVTDFHTAYIRLEKYFEFLLGIDPSYAFPDFDEIRIEMVSESGYFHFLNAVGLIFAAVILLTFAPFFRIAWAADLLRNYAARGFGILVIYYAIAALFGNLIMSFPNNQLFFISVGVTVAVWRAKSGNNLKI